jgi:excisionase family DNA binding protein
LLPLVTDEAMQKIDHYLKVAEAAELLGVSQNTLRSWADAGRVPAHVNPVNGYRLFKREDLEAFLESLERSPSKRKAK